MTAFRVRTAVLDLPPLVGALARRLHDAGVPVDTERAARLAQALAVVRPVARRRLYWTVRSVLVSDLSQVPTFDRVFAAVFGGAAERSPEPIVEDVHQVPAEADEQPDSDRTPDRDADARSGRLAGPVARSRRRRGDAPAAGSDGRHRRGGDPHQTLRRARTR